jgi:hypothetical protein
VTMPIAAPATGTRFRRATIGMITGAIRSSWPPSA